MNALDIATDIWSNDYTLFYENTGSVEPKALFSSFENQLNTEWMNKFKDLISIRSLDDNWDSEGAEAPMPELIDSAIELLEILKNKGYVSPPVRIVATPDGTVIFEWQNEIEYMEVEISEPYYAEWMLEKPDAPMEHWVEEAWGTNNLLEGFSKYFQA